MYTQIEEMLGKVFVSVEQKEDELIFKTETEVFTFLHYQDCCESVYIESVVGDLEDLVGEPLVRAEESTQDDPDAYELGMWTFYPNKSEKPLHSCGGCKLILCFLIIFNYYTPYNLT